MTSHTCVNMDQQICSEEVAALLLPGKVNSTESAAADHLGCLVVYVKRVCSKHGRRPAAKLSTENEENAGATN